MAVVVYKAQNHLPRQLQGHAWLCTAMQRSIKHMDHEQFWQACGTKGVCSCSAQQKCQEQKLPWSCFAAWTLSPLSLVLVRIWLNTGHCVGM